MTDHFKEEAASPGKEAVVYEPPALRDLGTVAELTRGNGGSPTDGFGGSSAIPS
jgi:hypothetical protein